MTCGFIANSEVFIYSASMFCEASSRCLWLLSASWQMYSSYKSIPTMILVVLRMFFCLKIPVLMLCHLRFKEIHQEAQRVSSSRAPQLSAEHTSEDHGLLCQHQVHWQISIDCSVMFNAKKGRENLGVKPFITVGLIVGTLYWTIWVYVFSVCFNMTVFSAYDKNALDAVWWQV